MSTISPIHYIVGDNSLHWRCTCRVVPAVIEESHVHAKFVQKGFAEVWIRLTFSWRWSSHRQNKSQLNFCTHILSRSDKIQEWHMKKDKDLQGPTAQYQFGAFWYHWMKTELTTGKSLWVATIKILVPYLLKKEIKKYSWTKWQAACEYQKTPSYFVDIPGIKPYPWISGNAVICLKKWVYLPHSLDCLHLQDAWPHFHNRREVLWGSTFAVEKEFILLK